MRLERCLEAIFCVGGLLQHSIFKREPVGDTNTAVMDSLKVLDLEPPIREADIKHDLAQRAGWRLRRVGTPMLVRNKRPGR
jgi:hypothetical protein